MRPAREARGDELEELLHLLRRDLDQRGERLPPSWTAEAIDDLRLGRLAGWFAPRTPSGGALGFYSTRTGRCFGHLHVVQGPEAIDQARSLLEKLSEEPRRTGVPLTVGVSGLTEEQETELASGWAGPAHRSVLFREGLECRLGPEVPADPGPPASEVRRVNVRSVPLAQLVDLDFHGFAGSEDAALFARDRPEYERMLSGILAGRLGRFLDEASSALVAPDGRPMGVLLTTELSPHLALFVDVVVDPHVRGRGFGRYLLRWGLRAVAALGHDAVRLWVTEGNRPARSLYEQLGFRRYARSAIFRQEIGDSAPHPQRSA